MDFNTIKNIVHYITGSVCFLGLLGHALAVYVLVKTKKQTYNSVLLCALSVSDILVLLYNISQKIIAPSCLELGFCDCYVNGRSSYLWLAWLFVTMCMIWIIVMATYGRYLVVSYPFMAQDWTRPKYGFWALLAIVVISLMCILPLLILTCLAERKVPWPNGGTLLQHENQTSEVFETHHNDTVGWTAATNWIGEVEQNDTTRLDFKHKCSNHTRYNYRENRRFAVLNYMKKSSWWCPYQKMFLSGFMMYLAPMTLLLYLNSKLIVALKRAHEAHMQITTVEEKENHAATVNIVAIVVIFMTFHSPNLIQTLDCFHKIHWGLEFWLFFHSLPAYNSAVDFILYFLFYKTLRQEARMLLRTCCSRKFNAYAPRWRLRRDLSTCSSMVTRCEESMMTPCELNENDLWLNGVHRQIETTET